MDFAADQSGDLVMEAGDFTVFEGIEELAEQINYVLENRRASVDPLTGNAVDGENRYDQEDGIDLTLFFGGKPSEGLVAASVRTDLREQVPAAETFKVTAVRTGTTIDLEIQSVSLGNDAIRAFVQSP